MAIRSDRIKKLEAELADLEHWLKLGLVPKKDIPKHESEIEAVRKKIEDEKQKLQFLKETGEGEEYVTPRRQASRTQYTETPTMPDLEVGEESTTLTEVNNTAASETVSDTAYPDERTEEDETASEVDEEDDPFSDTNRWRRGMLHGDDDEW